MRKVTCEESKESMVEVLAARLSGKALDWAVGRALGAEVKGYAFCSSPGSYITPNCTVFPPCEVMPKGGAYSTYAPSTVWDHAGKIISAFSIEFEKIGPATWRADTASNSSGFGPDHLIAACRAVVFEKFGSSLSIPASLAGDEPCCS